MSEPIPDREPTLDEIEARIERAHEWQNAGDPNWCTRYATDAAYLCARVREAEATVNGLDAQLFAESEIWASQLLAAEARVTALKDALRAIERGLESLGRYNHQPDHPFPYGAVLGLEAIASHALSVGPSQKPEGATS